MIGQAAGATATRLGAGQWRALTSICDTFFPGGDGVRPASRLGVPAAAAEAIAALPPGARAQALALLAAWDVLAAGIDDRGVPRRFSSLPLPRRERILRQWCDSRLGRRRAAFQALRKAAVLLVYTVPGEDRPVSDVCARIGYPGAIGPPVRPAPRAVRPTPVRGDRRLDCDVCVVGSGAGGGTAAGVLTAAGLDVVVLEAGGYYDDADFDGAELAGYRRLYLDGGSTATVDHSVGLMAGSCLGGGTTVNYTTAFPTPADVREEWAGHGLPAFAAADFGRSLEAVCSRLGVNRDHNRPSRRDLVLARGLARLGWHRDAMPRVVQGCDQGESCGYCAFGCRLGAKQSTVKTWLRDAAAAGARILVRTRAERVLVAGGAASGVRARTADGHVVIVRARAVVAAAGALHTPALLRRSGLTDPNLGRHLRLHPIVGVAGVFDERLRPWEGTMQALYSDEHRWLTGGYGVKYESGPTHPSLLAAFAPWRGARQHATLMGALEHTAPVVVLLRDRGAGRVAVDRHGHPRAHYRLSDFDVGHLRAGVAGAARILEAAGAHTIYTSHTRLVSCRPGRRGAHERFLADADACGWRAGQCVLYSFHLMGSARMGGWRATSACDPEGQTWEVPGLYVCDGAALPTAPGVNPMVTIEAVAHMTACALAERLGAVT